MVGELAQWNSLPFDSALNWCLSWKDASVFDCGNRQPRVSSLLFSTISGILGYHYVDFSRDWSLIIPPTPVQTCARNFSRIRTWAGKHTRWASFNLV